MREVKGEQLVAEQELGRVSDRGDELTIEQVRALIRGVQDAVAVLSTADPKLKAQVYAELGVEATYEPDRARVLVSACVGQSVSEGRLVP